MRSLQTLKIAVAVAGLGVFFMGIRMGNDVLRWTGIGLVATAVLVRFVRPRQ